MSNESTMTEKFNILKKAKTFIAGRALAGEKGQETAEALKVQIDRYWN